MYNASQGARGIPNKSKYEQKYENFRYSYPKTATDMGVSSSESHDLTAFYEMVTASFGVLSQNTGFYPSLDRIVETMLRPLNLGPGGRSYNEPISCLQCAEVWMQGVVQSCVTCGVQYAMHQSMWKSFGDALEKCGVQYAGLYSDITPLLRGSSSL